MIGGYIKYIKILCAQTIFLQQKEDSIELMNKSVQKKLLSMRAKAKVEALQGRVPKRKQAQAPAAEQGS